MYICISISLSLYTYIYIYIYTHTYVGAAAASRLPLLDLQQDQLRAGGERGWNSIKHIYYMFKICYKIYKTYSK